MNRWLNYRRKEESTNGLSYYCIYDTDMTSETSYKAILVGHTILWSSTHLRNFHTLPPAPITPPAQKEMGHNSAVLTWT